ncbi:MAG TPA: TRAP transporter small permease subunit [Syntrophorhabdaceae bacterium]|nr:TRAP transporter small permease subunit [Syntrophorhabdaceae bacterium]
MGTFEKVIHKIGNWGTVLGAAFMLAIALIVTFTVMGRAVHIAFPGTFDLVETMMVVSIAFALVFGQLQDRHLRTELALERIKGRLKSGLETFLSVLNLFYWVVLLYTGIQLGIERYIGGETTELLEVPVTPFRMVWIFALILMVILLAMRLFHHIKMLIKGGEEK